MFKRKLFYGKTRQEYQLIVNVKENIITVLNCIKG